MQATILLLMFTVLIQYFDWEKGGLQKKKKLKETDFLESAYNFLVIIVP